MSGAPLESSKATVHPLWDVAATFRVSGWPPEFRMLIVALTIWPGVTLKYGPGATSTMSIRNSGGQPDTLNVAATSQSGWTVALLDSNGAPLTDTNADGFPDVGLVQGLQTATFVVQVTVPAGATPGTLDLTVVVGSSSIDANSTSTSNVVLEYYGPGPSDWPTF